MWYVAPVIRPRLMLQSWHQLIVADHDFEMDFSRRNFINRLAGKRRGEIFDAQHNIPVLHYVRFWQFSPHNWKILCPKWIWIASYFQVLYHRTHQVPCSNCYGEIWEIIHCVCFCCWRGKGICIQFTAKLVPSGVKFSTVRHLIIFTPPPSRLQQQEYVTLFMTWTLA